MLMVKLVPEYSYLAQHELCQIRKLVVHIGDKDITKTECLVHISVVLSVLVLEILLI